MFGKKISNVFLFLFFMVFLFCGRVYSEPLYLPLLTVFQDGHEVYTLGADRGAMGVQIGAFIKAELPIITTVPPLYQYKNEAIFQELKDEDKWRVYINKDNTFVLLLPKSFIEMVLPKINNKLMALGFNEGYLTLIKSSELDKVFSNDIYKNISIDMSHFDKFFIKEPEEKKPFDKYLQERILEKTPIPAKMIIATGHGAANASQVVGVKVEQYKEFLKILNKIKAKFLVVNSCYSGGENLLKMHDLLLSKMPGDFLALLNYPIVINATMAEVSIAGTPEKFENLNIFFRRIEPIIENKQFYFGVPVSRVEGLVKKRQLEALRKP